MQRQKSRSRSVPAALVQLDVPAAGMRTPEIACGVVAVRERYLEEVVAARFALVAGAHTRRAGRVIDRDLIVDDAAVGIRRIRGVANHSGGLHMHAVAVI